MKQEYKELLLKDLCARLPYKTQCRIKYIINNETTEGEDIEQEIDDEIIEIRLKYQEVKTDWVDEFYDISCIKPYLRPMSSMTEEEREELSHYENPIQRTDFYYSHHIDCRFMIEKGLALEAPTGMY